MDLSNKISFWVRILPPSTSFVISCQVIPAFLSCSKIAHASAFRPGWAGRSAWWRLMDRIFLFSNTYEGMIRSLMALTSSKGSVSCFNFWNTSLGGSKKKGIPAAFAWFSIMPDFFCPISYKVTGRFFSFAWMAHWIESFPVPMTQILLIFLLIVPAPFIF